MGHKIAEGGGNWWRKSFAGLEAALSSEAREGAQATRQEATPVVTSFPERPVRARSRQGDPEEEKCIGYYEGIQQKTQEEGIIGGGDASLDEGGHSPRGLAGSRWLGMVKAFRKESGVAPGQKRKAAKAGNLLKCANPEALSKNQDLKKVSQVFGGMSAFVSRACSPHLPNSRAVPTRCQYRSTPLHICFEEGEKGVVKTFKTYICLKMCFQIDVCA